jgi:hypothetical protein
MVQQLNNIQIAAPGFSGLNTQESPVGMSLAYASVADNCVIDNYGRIASRKGLSQYTKSVNSTLGLTAPAEKTFEFIDVTGDSWLFVVGNGKIYRQQQTTPWGLVELAYPGGYSAVTSTQNNWQMVALDDRCYFIQEGLIPLQFLASTGLLTAMGTAPSYPSALGHPSCATTAFGRLFVGGFDLQKSLIVYSSLNAGGALTWAGTIDVTQFWPAGVDTITAIKAHNGFLIIFGKRSVIIYAVPDTGPEFATLADTIEGIGCVARDSLVEVGTDLYFLDATGARSFGRTITEKSVPIGDISWNIKTDIQRLIKNTLPKDIVGVYNPEDNLYTVSFPTQNTLVCFNTKGYLENGSLKTTMWPLLAAWGGCRTVSGKTFYSGIGGLFEYTGAEDMSYLSVGPLRYHTATPTVVGDTVFNIPFKYWTQPQHFDKPVNLKLLKQLDITFIGGTDVTLYLKWDFNYQGSPTSMYLNYQAGSLQALYNEGFEYNLGAEYSGQGETVQTHSINIWGSGKVVKFGFEADVFGAPFSIQELNMQALLGRMS